MVQRRVLTEDERAFLRDNYPERVNLLGAAAALRCGPHVAKRELAAMGIDLMRPGGQPKLSVEKRQAILDAWAEGKAAWRIGRELGSASETVKSVLAAAGIDWENRLARGPASPSWKGGRVRSGEYVAVYVEADDPMRVMAQCYGYVMEHRLVVARHLGRPLTRKETVHHINGEKLDNRLENLQLRSGRHGTGVVMVCHDCGSANVGAVQLATPTGRP